MFSIKQRTFSTDSVRENHMRYGVGRLLEQRKWEVASTCVASNTVAAKPGMITIGSMACVCAMRVTKAKVRIKII